MGGRQTLSARQIYALARRAGLAPGQATTATAVALAESSGRTWVTSPNPDGGTNVGLWQLDTPGGEGAGYTADQLQDPWTNAQVMAKTTDGGNLWGPWETYVDGTYRQFMSDALVASTDEPAPSRAADTGGSWVSDILKTIEWPVTLGRDAGKAAAAAAGAAGGLIFPADITKFFDTGEKLLAGGLWFLNPSNWVRLMAGGAGVVLAVLAVVALVKAA